MPDVADATVLLDTDGDSDGAVAVLRLNRPAVRNALDAALVRRLGSVLLELDDDPDVRAVVLTGSSPGFCAGSDLTELAGLPVSERIPTPGTRRLPGPVVAAAEHSGDRRGGGLRAGGRLLLATSCDIVVSSGQARWQLPEVALGWVPPWGLHSLVSRVGPVAGRRLAWGEEPLSGRQAHRIGVVDELSEPGAGTATGPGHRAQVGCVAAERGDLCQARTGRRHRRCGREPRCPHLVDVRGGLLVQRRSAQLRPIRSHRPTIARLEAPGRIGRQGM